MVDPEPLIADGMIEEIHHQHKLQVPAFLQQMAALFSTITSTEGAMFFLELTPFGSFKLPTSQSDLNPEIVKAYIHNEADDDRYTAWPFAAIRQFLFMERHLLAIGTYDNAGHGEGGEEILLADLRPRRRAAMETEKFKEYLEADTYLGGQVFHYGNVWCDNILDKRMKRGEALFEEYVRLSLNNYHYELLNSSSWEVLDSRDDY